MESLLECHVTNIEDIECCLRFCKLTLIPVLTHINDLTVFTLHINSLMYDDFSLPVHSYQLLHKSTK